MRTTVNIDEQLLARARDQARQQGRTLGEIIEDALRLALSAARVKTTVIKLPVAKEGGGLPPGIEPSTRGLLAVLDEGQPVDRLR